MSEVKFTKGRWEAKVDESCGIDVALIYLGNKGGFDLSGAPDCIANANLIAAAPEMYEMLDSLSDYSTFQGVPAWVHDIKLLLAKARGEE